MEGRKKEEDEIKHGEKIVKEKVRRQESGGVSVTPPIAVAGGVCVGDSFQCCGSIPMQKR